jgi:hypothetical protein
MGGAPAGSGIGRDAAELLAAATTREPPRLAVKVLELPGGFQSMVREPAS